MSEQANWGVQALAALSDQAGVKTTSAQEPEPWGAQAVAVLTGKANADEPPRLANARTSQTLSISVPPPPVSDPTIEEAFAFMPPPPPAETQTVPATLPALATIIPHQDFRMVPKTNALLEDELVDEHHDPAALMDGAFESPTVDIAEQPPPTESEQTAADPALEAIAFVEEENPPAESEWAAPRLAHTTPSPESEPIRRPTGGTALKAQVKSAARSSEEEGFGFERSRGKRIAVILAACLGIGGAAVAGLWAFGVIGYKAASPPLANKGSKADAALSEQSSPGSKTTEQNVPATQKANGKPTNPPPAATGKSQPATDRTSAKNGVATVDKVAAKVSATEKAGTKPGIPEPGKAPAKADPPPVATGDTAKPVVPAVAPTSIEPKIVAAKPSPTAPTTTSSSAKVNVSVESKPEGAMVWVDGEAMGKTPCVVKVKSGQARFVLVHAGFQARQTMVAVREGARVVETLEAATPPMEGEARFRVECKTEGKLPILVDGKETGILCPFTKMRVDPGTHTIGVLLPATGKVREKEITLSAGVRSVMFQD
jgi:hypothetical protein